VIVVSVENYVDGYYVESVGVADSNADLNGRFSSRSNGWGLIFNTGACEYEHNGKKVQVKDDESLPFSVTSAKGKVIVVSVDMDKKTIKFISDGKSTPDYPLVSYSGKYPLHMALRPGHSTLSITNIDSEKH